MIRMCCSAESAQPLLEDAVLSFFCIVFRDLEKLAAEAFPQIASNNGVYAPRRMSKRNH